MTTVSPSGRDAAPSGSLNVSQIAELRRAIFRDGQVSRAEATDLFAVERARRQHERAWSELFVEAVTDYALNQEPPVGYLSQDTADWLVAEISRRKVPSTDAEVALVINLIENAREVPASFSAFALRLVKNMVMYGDGLDAMGRPHDGGRVTEADVHALQRILWGAGSEGLLAVSREEAEALFAIAHNSAGANNDPQFDALFAKSIGNYLLAATGRSVPTRDISLRWETEGPHKADVIRVLTQTLASSSKAADTEFVIDTIRNSRSLQRDVDATFEAANASREQATLAAGVVTTDEAAWLLDHVGHNGVMTAPEKALLRFIAREASAIDPTLRDVLAKVA